MQRMHGWFAGLSAALVLTACGGGGHHDDSAAVAVDDLAEGRYVVSVGDESSPTVGKYYAAADGSRLLVLADGDDRATQIYRRAAGDDSWQAVPAPGAVRTVTLLHSSALPKPAAIDATSLAGGYVTRLADGEVARFSIRGDGSIVAGDSVCRLSGQLSRSSLPGALQLVLSAAGCAGLPASSRGTLVPDDDYRPARFRLIADDDRRPLDIWGHAE
ncbi:MAG: hypothetical protein QM766_04710 [Burkholderiaceae bacterium]